MGAIPITSDPLVLRTDFSNDKIWKLICDHAVLENEDSFSASVECYSDQQFDGMAAEKIIADLPSNYSHSFLFIVDHESITHDEHPVLCVDHQ